MQELRQPQSQGSAQAQHGQPRQQSSTRGTAQQGGTTGSTRTGPTGTQGAGTMGAQGTGATSTQTGAMGTQQTGTQQPQQLFPTQNFLPERTRRASIQALNQSLADTVVMHSQLQSAHWNVKGWNFYQLHELFEDLAEELEDHIDELAERATALGGFARGTTYEAARESRLDPIPAEVCDEGRLLNEIARNLSRLDSELNWHMEALEDQGDLDTIDLLNEVSRDVSKMLWFVEAHVQQPPTGGQGMDTKRGSQGARQNATQPY